MRGECIIMRFAYGMRARGFSIGCQPMKGWESRIDDSSCRYYDIVVYNRQLTEREVSDYELDYLGTIEEYREKMRRIY